MPYILNFYKSCILFVINDKCRVCVCVKDQVLTHMCAKITR